MNKVVVSAIAVFAGLSAPSVLAALSVFACEPEWASLTETLGGDGVSVYQASTAMQDPHRIEARPSLIAKMRSADLVICTGAELETGWLPVLLQTAGNPRVQPGSKGFIAAADYVERLEIPTRLDRAEGDIHPGGNPHIQLDPHNIAKVASVMSERLASLDPTHAATYTSRGQDFQTRWATAITRWEEIAAPLKGMRLVPYHKDTVYLIHWLGMVEVMDIEPKPGIPPSAGYLSELVARIGQEGADAIAHSAYQDPKAARWLADHTGKPLVDLPYTVGGTPAAKDLFGLFDDTIARLNQARNSVQQIEISILLPALCAGLLVCATHVPLGIQVLRRGIVFIDIAIAQIAGVGVIAADYFGWETSGYAVQISALGAALSGALFLTWTERRWPDIQEGIIGTVLVLAATVQVLLLAGNPHGGEYLKDMLVGQILWVGYGQLAIVAALTAVVLGAWFGVGAPRLGRIGFYLLFGLSVTASVQVVGIYLVFSTLIIPALATRNANRYRTAKAYAVGGVGYSSGLIVSVLTDLPTGALIVWTMAATGIVFASFERSAAAALPADGSVMAREDH